MNENSQDNGANCSEAVDDTSENFLNMRMVIFQNLCNWYATERAPSRSLYNSLQKNRHYLFSKPSDALDAVRGMFQKAINREIDTVIQRFFEKYLSPAVSNISANGYEVTQVDINGVYRRLLEEAKRMYPLDMPSTNEAVDSVTNTSANSESIGLPSLPATTLPQKLVNRHIPAALRKRKEAVDSDTESDISQASVGLKKKAKQEGGFGHGKRVPATSQSSTTAALKTTEIPFDDVEKWNPNRIDENTIFVLGSKANSSLGLSAQRGRIYIKHPGLFRYVGDHEDKMWLFENKQKTVKFGGKAFLVILDDIVQLSETSEYRNNPEVRVDNLNGFTLPAFIIDKIKSKLEPIYASLCVRYGINSSSARATTPTMGNPINLGPIQDETGTNLNIFNLGAQTSPYGTSDGGSDL